MVSEGVKTLESSRKMVRSLECIITYKRRRLAGSRGIVKPCHDHCKEKEFEDMRLHGSCEQDERTRLCQYWRTILQKILDSLDGDGIGIGIVNCIQNTLAANPFNYVGKSEKEKNEVLSEFMPHFEGSDASNERVSEAAKLGVTDKDDRCVNKIMCQSILFDILFSQKFTLLCDLLRGNFQETATRDMIDFKAINSKMQKEFYKHSSLLFGKDILQVWEKFRKVGEQMSLLANCLIAISLSSYKKRVRNFGDGMLCTSSDEKRCAEISHFNREEKISMNSCNITQLPSYESDRSNRPDTEASCLHNVCSCKYCGNEADGKTSLVCDGCEAMYHLSCIGTTTEIFPQNWYCGFCQPRFKSGLPEHIPSKEAQEDHIHQNCPVCVRLEISVSEEHKVRPNISTSLHTNNDRESSISSDSDEQPLEPSRTAKLHLCKYCGTPEDESRKFIICGHDQCLYKYYHLRCLKESKLALLQQDKRPCWFCPSCLCRACFSDKDDEKIVLCDGCDDAFHTYCTNPPLAYVPKGKWYCNECNIKRAKEGIRLYEESILQKLGGMRGKSRGSGAKHPMNKHFNVGKKTDIKA